MFTRISSILVLLSFLLNIAGFYPAFKWEQWQVRKEIKRRVKSNVPEDELHVIAFGKNQKIPWIKEDKEFMLNDRLYDVVRSEEKSDSIVYHCINDVQEHHLFACLDQMVNKYMNHPANKNHPVKNLKVFNSLVYLHTDPCSFEMPELHTKLSFNYLSDYSGILLLKDSPPPENLV